MVNSHSDDMSISIVVAARLLLSHGSTECRRPSFDDMLGAMVSHITKAIVTSAAAAILVHLHDSTGSTADHCS